jgi:hypothetical protein
VNMIQVFYTYDELRPMVPFEIVLRRVVGLKGRCECGQFDLRIFHAS